MSVLSDEESVGSVLAEEGKEARRRTENLSATFAEVIIDDARCGWEHDVCLGEMYEQWASLVAAARNNGSVR